MAKATKSPKEASNLFHSIMKASVSKSQKNKNISIADQIKKALKDKFETDKSFVTSVNGIVQAVKDKNPNAIEADIKTTLGNMKGWKRVGPSLDDQAEIDPSFFE